MQTIARIHSDFSTKFGIPRQSGLIPSLTAKVVFEQPYRNADALRGLEGFSHIWLLWEFSQNIREEWSPTVRPPRLGGNTRMGVFATRSPFRPNPIGLSCVTLESIDYESEEGPVLYVGGADLLDGTPIYDIKPYLPYTDCHPEAKGGFAERVMGDKLEVVCSGNLINKLPEEKRAALLAVLSQDPRPAYQEDPDRVYGMNFAGFEIRFKVVNSVLNVQDIYLVEGES